MKLVIVFVVAMMAMGLAHAARSAPPTRNDAPLWYRNASDDGWLRAHWACELERRVLVMTRAGDDTLLLTEIDRAHPEKRRTTTIARDSEGCGGMMKCYWDAPQARKPYRHLLELTMGPLAIYGHATADKDGPVEYCAGGGPTEEAMGDATTVCMTGGADGHCIVQGEYIP